ncbi:MAG: A/G-specific adenine glycosylase [Bacteroidetes bacterium OLB11]|nr:MAG: A/G-specific adenine glycosylase [Bacteroidetes bacterium OLB11]
MDTVYFRKKLLQWNEKANHRQLIWRGEKDAYRVWLREIILQQTRVELGEKYYISFLKKYPTINDFAKANLDELYRLWQGLGYYSRCKNMWLTAQTIKEQYNGIFPADYEKLLALKGIGKYTAAAISSFAFDLPYAVVDGNVVRVLSRFYGIQNGFHSIKDKQKYEEYAIRLLDKKRNAIYNQAIMDFGAIICKPQNPLCDLCPMKMKCYAFNQNEIQSFPATKKRPN